MYTQCTEMDFSIQLPLPNQFSSAKMIIPIPLVNDITCQNGE